MPLKVVTTTREGRPGAAYDERKRIFHVERMWAEGLTPASAARVWGRPSRASLSKWQRDAMEGRLDARMREAPHACEHAKHARYPAETRAEALRLRGEGLAPAQIARMLGLASGSTVSGWAREEAALAPSPPSRPPPRPLGPCRLASRPSLSPGLAASDSAVKPVHHEPTTPPCAHRPRRRRLPGIARRRYVSRRPLTKRTHSLNCRSCTSSRRRMFSGESESPFI